MRRESLNFLLEQSSFREIVRHEIWCTRKFVNNEDQIKDICEDIMHLSDQLKHISTGGSQRPNLAFSCKLGEER